jgi:hypothetical protein
MANKATRSRPPRWLQLHVHREGFATEHRTLVFDDRAGTWLVDDQRPAAPGPSGSRWTAPHRTLDADPTAKQLRVFRKIRAELADAIAGDKTEEELAALSESLPVDAPRMGKRPEVRARASRWFFAQPKPDRLDLTVYKLRQRYTNSGRPGSPSALAAIFGHLQRDEKLAEQLEEAEAKAKAKK